MRTVNGISFDGLHSYDDFGMWIAKERPDWGSPLPKTNIVDVPGMDGVLDMTDVNAGGVKYSNRIITLTFAAMVPWSAQEAFKAKLMNALHGKVINRIIADEDPDWFYTGRATVEFRDISSWRLKIIVTVDAFPYALAVEPTTVNLIPSGDPDMETIDIPAADVSEQDWNSDLRLGTRTFPAGLGVPANALQQLIVRWPDDASLAPKKTYFIQIVDNTKIGSGEIENLYEATIDKSVLPQREFRVDLSSLAAAHVTAGRVWRVLVSGIGSCSLHAEMLSYRFDIENGTKPVIPQFVLVTNNNPEGEEPEVFCPININGRNYTISSNAENEEIMLEAGTNQIMIPVTFFSENQVDEFYMVFRKGRL